MDPAFRAYAPMLAGRRGGIINVGGLKVHSEEIEAVINRHPSVRVSLGQGRQYPVAGSIVVADVVLKGKGCCRQIAGAVCAERRYPQALSRNPAASIVPTAISFVPASRL